MKGSRILLTFGAVVLAAAPAFSQALPRVASLYPAGTRAGTTLDVAIRGGGLDGAREVIVDGAGLTAKLNDSGIKVDPEEQKLFTAKCSQCHELRGPGNISRTADQWVATVDRMIKEKAAPIEGADRAKIVNYVQAAARASAGLTARIQVAADATPGTREIRVVASNGTSTVFPFEVTRDPEGLDTEPNNTVDKPQAIKLPVTINGQLLGNSDADSFAFDAAKGERLVFNCNAFRMNPASQAFFFPVLYLYDAKGKELVRNNGYFSIDPLIDWTAPEAGKYVIQVRDMLYRSSPSSVYRLSIGSMPYDTYLFPAGGKRGATAHVELSGKNLDPAAVDLPLAANAPVGVRLVATPRGRFPFVAGDYEEFTEAGDGKVETVTLPVSINGRIEDGKADRYSFTLDKEHLGAYTFDVFADRVGSPLQGVLTLRNEKGQSLVSNTGGRRSDDPRVDYTFSQPGTYTLEIADDSGKGSPAHVYRISAGPSEPDFTVTVTPDNPNLGPGTSVYLQLRARRRIGINGDIEVTFPNLPAGVTASPGIVSRENSDTFVVLTAAADAKPGSFSLVDAIASATVEGKTLRREVQPYEIYRINNSPLFAYRQNMVVTVGPSIGWRVAIEPGNMRMAPGGGPVEVTVKLDRNGTDGDLPFAIVGLPNGVNAPRSLLFKKGQSELKFTMTPTNQGIFAPRDGKQPPPPSQFFLAVVNGREGEGMQMCSPAVAVQIATNLASR